MKPAPVDLPTIWRGSDWSAIFFSWKDQNGNPFDLTGFVFKAQTSNIDLNGTLVGAPNQGVTAVSLTHEVTATLKLGVEQWNCWFVDSVGNVTPPFLAGKIPVKEKNSAT